MTMALVDLAKHVEAILEGSIARQQIALGELTLVVAPERIVCPAFQPGALTCVANNFRSPLTPVRHGHDFDLGSRQHIAQAFRDVFSNLPRVERAFEFIRGNKDFHRSTGILPVGPAGVSPAGSHALGS